MLVKNLDIYQGDTCIFDLSILQSDGVQVDLAGARLVMQAVPQGGDSVEPKIEMSGNRVSLIFEAAQTALFDWRRADYDLRLVSGADVITLARGILRVTPSVTPVRGLLTDAQGTERLRVEKIGVVLDKSVLVIGGAVIDPNLPDLIDFYMTHGVAVAGDK